MDLAVTAIFRNEAPYLKEWIEFHLLMGFEHFHLFDNLSTDQPRMILEPYISKGLVELTSWPIDHSDIFEWNEVQCLAYERAIYQACGRTKWLAILDVDEFLFPTQGSILDALNPFEDVGGVAVNWQVFGTSRVAQIPSGQKMIKLLNFKLPENQGVNHHVKSIVRPERVFSCDNPHSMNYKEGFGQVNLAGIPFAGRISPTVELGPLRINHYTLRDEHYFTTQKIPRLQKWWQGTEATWREKYALINQIEDTTIHRFL